jgi:hypothetical protein
LPTYRRVKGSNLTPDEADDNILELRTDLDNVIANPPTANSIESVEASGFFWTITLTDSTVLPPLPIPVVQFRWRGEWAPFTLYDELDTFKVTDRGIFSVMVAHTSAATFDDQEVGGSPPALLYNELIEVTSVHGVSAVAGDYTLVLTDADDYIRVTSGNSPATEVFITVPAEADVPFVVGTTVAFEQLDDSGGVTIAGAGGVTINISPALTPTTNGQFAVAQIKKVAADSWTLFGNLVPT